MIAGVSLTYMRSFRVGDVIKVGDSTGVVLERRLYITRLKTFKNEVITIPNGIILTSHVTNLSQEVRKGDGLILHTSVTIGYDAPWETVHACSSRRRTEPHISSRVRRPLCCKPRSTIFT